MPPKKKKQATTAAKATTRKKKDAKDAPKSGVSLSAKSWTLSGGLSVLPLELIQHILLFLVTDSHYSMEGCKSVLRFLSTTKALYSFSLESDTLFYKLYCAVQPHGFSRLDIRHIEKHPMFSPTYNRDNKLAQPMIYKIDAPLPRDAIFDWREQFIALLIYAEAKHCVHCRASQEVAVLVKLDHWETRLCMRCCGRYLTRKADITKLNVTNNDVGGLVTHVYQISQGSNKPEKEVEYYCGTQLLALAAQKHGEYKTAKNAPKAKADARQARSDLLCAFALLQCGTSGSWRSWHEMHQAVPPEVDPGWFYLEFDRAVSRSGYRKSVAIRSATLGGKGTPYPTKLREVEEIMMDWGKYIKPHMHLMKKKGPAGVVEPFFQPAQAPGPLIPTEASVTAYVTLREALHGEGFQITDTVSGHEIKAFQEYVLSPSQEALAAALSIARQKQRGVDSGIEYLRHPDAVATANPDKDSSNAADEGMRLQATINSLAEEAKVHVWPAFEATPSQIAHEEEVVKVIAAREKIPEAAARKARLDRVNHVVRAAAVANFEPGKAYLTKCGDLESLKWSLIYDTHAEDSEPFGAEYVDAVVWNRAAAKKKMLLDVYKGTSAAREARVDQAIKKQKKTSDPWYAYDPLVYSLSTTLLGYKACSAKKLTDRTKYPFKDVLASVTSVIEDCRANLITLSSIDALLRELSLVAIWKCPYRPSRPFCVHNDNWQCWFRHIHPNGTEWMDTPGYTAYASSDYSMSSEDQMICQMEHDEQEEEDNFEYEF